MVFYYLSHSHAKENGGHALRDLLTYRPYRKWILTLGVLMLSFSLPAQSDQPADTTILTEVTAGEAASDLTNETAEIRIFRSTPDSTIQRMQHQKEFAYANDPAYWKKDKPAQPRDSWLGKLSRSIIFQYFLFGLMIAILMFAIVRILLSNKILLFTTRKKFIPVSTGEELLEEADFANLVAQSEQQRQFRLATRYRYLQLLRGLNDRQLIRLNTQLTNRDYVKQLASHPLGNKFRYLTQAYEYVWYGGFDLDAAQYELLKTNFESFLP